MWHAVAANVRTDMIPTDNLFTLNRPLFLFYAMCTSMS
ncbi:hypothetical protein VRK_08940 [Vibrio sp. MEBiC08052]|nr:hypothetical protein VRK_08940 [Vibrio sp. MEBiC08052]